MPKSHYCEKCSSHYFYDTKVTKSVFIEDNKIKGVYLTYSTCPSCGTLYYRLLGEVAGGFVVLQDVSAADRNKAAPAEVPFPIGSDYAEAAAVLSISPKASAALSRRCLQHMLRERGYEHRNLVTQIEAVLAEVDPARAVPDTLRIALDAIRNFGNFSAHPMTDQTSLQVVDVEVGEAEWCLEILEECFECFYVRPARVEERKRALNDKLATVGKPPAK